MVSIKISGDKKECLDAMLKISKVLEIDDLAMEEDKESSTVEMELTIKTTETKHDIKHLEKKRLGKITIGNKVKSKADSESEDGEGKTSQTQDKSEDDEKPKKILWNTERQLNYQESEFMKEVSRISERLAHLIRKGR